MRRNNFVMEINARSERKTILFKIYTRIERKKKKDVKIKLES